MDQRPIGNWDLAAYQLLMTAKPLLALAAILLTCSCVTPTSPPAAVAVSAQRPVFVQYRPGQAARYRLTAAYDGVLTQRGRCLGVVRDGRFSTLIWPETARVAFGDAGLEVSEQGGARVRLGDRIEFNGGLLPTGMAHGFGDDVLSVDMPMACAHYPGYDGWIAIVNPGFRKRETRMPDTEGKSAALPLPPAEKVSFLQFLPGQNGGVKLTGGYGGILTQRGPCLGLVKDDFFSTMIWPETARISYDRRGLLLHDTRSGASARLGDWIEITGGPLPPDASFQIGPPVLNYVMPIECARRPVPHRPGWIGIANPGFRIRPTRGG